MIDFASDGLEASLDVPQAFSIRQLGETHDLKLRVATQLPDVLVSLVSLDALAELVLRHVIHQLRKYRPAILHSLPPFLCEWAEPCKIACSN
jgi:hypothetical protein